MKEKIRDILSDKKKLLIVIGAALAALIVIVGVILAVVLSGGDKDVYIIHVDMGDKYFVEEKYEEAIASYVIALNEAKDSDTEDIEKVYYNLAEAYKKTDKEEDAKNILVEGIEKTSDEKLGKLYKEYFGEEYKPDSEKDTDNTTKVPDSTVADETTKAPETTEAPEVTEAPDTTSAPEDTQAPVQNQNPQGNGGTQNSTGSGSLNVGGPAGNGNGNGNQQQSQGSSIPSGNVPMPQAASTKDAFPTYILTKSGKKLIHTYSDRAVDGSEDNSTNVSYMPMISTTVTPRHDESYNNPQVMLEDIKPGLVCNNVIIGYDGYMFYGDTVDDFTGQGFLNGTVYNRAVQILKDSANLAKANGKKFYVVIAPNKNTVYPDYMPEGYTMASYRRYDQFVEMLTASGITAVDIRVAMANAVKATPQKNFYYKYDTHWNNHAGYLAYEEMMKMIRKDYPNAILHPKSDYQINYIETYMKDQAYYLGHYSYFKDYGPQYTLKSGKTARLIDYEPKNAWGQFQFAYECTQGNNRGFSDKLYWLQYQNDYNKSAPNIYCLRDSYSIAMIPFLKDSFYKSTYNWSFSFESNKSDIRKSDADIIVAIVAERNFKNFVNQKTVTD